MVKKCIPILGASGFATDIGVKLIESTKNWLVTDYDQSTIFTYTPFMLLLMKYGQSPMALSSNVETALMDHLCNGFDGASVTAVATVDDATGTITLNISASVTDGVVSKDLAWTILSGDNSIKSIVDTTSGSLIYS